MYQKGTWPVHSNEVHSMNYIVSKICWGMYHFKWCIIKMILFRFKWYILTNKVQKMLWRCSLKMLFEDAIWRCYLRILFKDILKILFWRCYFEDTIWRCYLKMLFEYTLWGCYLKMLFKDALWICTLKMYHDVLNSLKMSRCSPFN